MRVVEAAVVADQSDLSPGVGLDQDHQEDEEVPAALGIGDGLTQIGLQDNETVAEDLGRWRGKTQPVGEAPP